MGVFKQIKDLKNVVAQAPGMVEQAQKMAQQAQQMQAAQMAAPGQMPQMGAPGGVDPALLEPIAGISLERYAVLAKSIGERKLDQTGVESFVKLQGHSPEDWQQAYDGWNARFKGNMALATQFGMLYQQARSL